MRAHRSITASLVAFGRGIGVGASARDPQAAALLHPLLGAVVRVATRGPAEHPLRGALRLATLGMVDHTTLRMLAIDRALRTAVDEGARQIVILGAGLDSRASQSPRRELTFFEVDHPATQRFKQSRVSAAHRAVFVPVDFEVDDLARSLEQAGHDRTVPTVWLWEGVTMYLRPPAIDATLQVIEARSGPKSTAIVSYVEPLKFPLGEAARPVVDLGFRIMGEPLYGLMDRREMRQRLFKHGFEVRSDGNSEDWALAEGRSGRLASTFRVERLATARFRRSRS
ncbi:MAG: SAM-dependent methyltransferase [Myxococcota bacterium]